MFLTTVLTSLYILLYLHVVSCFSVPERRFPVTISQQPTVNSSDLVDVKSNTPRIAIIGAGITGASLAHHLHRLAGLHQPLDIVVFDSENRTGGKIQSAHVFNLPQLSVESGAASFSDRDSCLKDAMQEVDLKPTRFPDVDHSICVWDGYGLLVDYDDNNGPLSRTGWQSLKWQWRYGSYLQTADAMSRDFENILSGFATLQYFPRLFYWLTETFAPAHIVEPASSFFQRTRANVKFVEEVIRAKNRYRHACDLHQVNTLTSLLAIRPTPEIAIEGGNKRLPDRLLKLSEARTLLNTRVSHISLGQERKWRVVAQPVQTADTGIEAETRSKYLDAEFDIVILTAPLAPSNITITPLPSIPPSMLNPAFSLTRHVTFFATRESLSPVYFNLPPNTKLAARILTAPKIQPVSSPEGGSNSSNGSGNDNEIFSITTVDRIPPPWTGDNISENDYVYKIVSSQPFPDNEIARILGHQYIDSGTLESIGVYWVHRKVWPHAVRPFTPGRPILDNLEIAPDMYYTAAAGEVVDTMEMGCRTGLKLAKYLWYTKWQGGRFP